MSPLDRPVWASLTHGHAQLSLGNGLARRYAPDVNLFAATRDDGPEALAALAPLVRAGETVALVAAATVAVPPGFEVVRAAPCVQLVATRPVPPEPGVPGIDTLGEDDAAEMLALATLTEPGPYLARTHTMGHFRGIRLDGRLAAMAGERFRFPGYTEVSGVCVHPDFRGRGLARRLSAAVAAGIEARGERPFLHAWETNAAAITLYEALGFRIRARVQVAVIRRRDDPAA